VRLGNVLNKLN